MCSCDCQNGSCCRSNTNNNSLYGVRVIYLIAKDTQLASDITKGLFKSCDCKVNGGDNDASKIQASNPDKAASAPVLTTPNESVIVTEEVVQVTEEVTTTTTVEHIETEPEVTEPAAEAPATADTQVIKEPPPSKEPCLAGQEVEVRLKGQSEVVIVRFDSQHPKGEELPVQLIKESCLPDCSCQKQLPSKGQEPTLPPQGQEPTRPYTRHETTVVEDRSYPSGSCHCQKPSVAPPPPPPPPKKSDKCKHSEQSCCDICCSGNDESGEFCCNECAQYLKEYGSRRSTTPQRGRRRKHKRKSGDGFFSCFGKCCNNSSKKKRPRKDKSIRYRPKSTDSASIDSAESKDDVSLDSRESKDSKDSSRGRRRNRRKRSKDRNNGSSSSCCRPPKKKRTADKKKTDCGDSRCTASKKYGSRAANISQSNDRCVCCSCDSQYKSNGSNR